MDLPPPVLPVTVSAPPSAVPPIVYPNSVDSSPRSRITDSWDDQLATVSGGGGKLRLMCSYGGHIVPRPHDKSLCYVGGDTRIVMSDRHSSLADLTARLSKTLLGGRLFTLKYQLPNEELDSLISVSTDEDLDNMIDEYDRISSSSSSSKPSRIRLFLFPSKPDSSSSIDSLLDNSTKSEDWLINALNGVSVISSGFSESQSVNCLLGLDNDDGGDGGGCGAIGVGGEGLEMCRDVDAQVKTGKRGQQDVQSVPDSPMLETTSSFGSTSSSPSMVNLPPIRVHVVEDHKVGGFEEQLISVAPTATQKLDEGFTISSSSPPPPIPSSILATAVPAVSVGSVPVSGEHPNRVLSDDERSEQGVPFGYWKPPQPQQQQQLAQQQKPNGGGGLDLPSPDSVSSDSSLINAMSRPKPTIYQDPVTGQLHSGISIGVSANHVDPNINIYDPNPRGPLLQQVQDPSSYVLTPQFDQQQQPQQFLHPRTHYFHHQPTGPVQFPSYYPVYPSQQHHQHHPQLEQPYPVYFVPARPTQAYNLSMAQSNLSETTNSTVPSSSTQAPPNPTTVTPSPAYNQTRTAPPPPKPEMAAGMYITAATAGAPTLLQVPSSQHQHQHQQQYVGLPQIHHASQSIAPNSTATANYAYEFVDPAHAHIYYSQALASRLPPQYQTMTTPPTAVLSETASHLQADNMKQQIRTSQPQ